MVESAVRQAVRPAAVASAAQPSIKVTGTRPSVDGGGLPHRRGRMEEVPKKKDSTAAGMLMMMQKASEQSAAWMLEDRKRAEEARVEGRRLAEARAVALEQARQDGLAEARRAHEQARLQVQLDQDALDQRAREAEMRATQQDEDPKAKRHGL